MRYGLAISQWREFRAWIAANNNLLALHYANVDAALHLAERRIRLLLRGLDCLYAAVVIFGVGALVGLIGAITAYGDGGQVLSVWLVIGIGAAGLTLLLSAMTLFVAENRCARGLLRLQLLLRSEHLKEVQTSEDSTTT
jgi:hypothetical protein